MPGSQVHFKIKKKEEILTLHAHLKVRNELLCNGELDSNIVILIENIDTYDTIKYIL